MSGLGRAAVILGGIGVLIYYTYKSFESSETERDRSCSSSESYYTVSEGQSGSEYLDIEEEQLQNDPLFEEVDKLMQGDESEIETAYSEMKDSFKFMSEDPNFLWRYAKVHDLMGRVSKNKAEELNKEGLNYAEKAVKKDPDNSEAHKWFAILTGRKAEFLINPSEKIKYAQIFVEHIQKALKLRPEDWELYHLLGIFAYQLASLSYFEKCFARSYFKGFSFEYRAAREYFENAEKYNATSSKETRLYLAKCLREEKDHETARKWLKKALDVEVKSINDKACHEEVKHLLKK